MLLTIPAPQELTDLDRFILKNDEAGVRRTVSTLVGRKAPPSRNALSELYLACDPRVTYNIFKLVVEAGDHTDDLDHFENLAYLLCDANGLLSTQIEPGSLGPFLPLEQVRKMAYIGANYPNQLTKLDSKSLWSPFYVAVLNRRKQLYVFLHQHGAMDPSAICAAARDYPTLKLMLSWGAPARGVPGGTPPFLAVCRGTADLGTVDLLLKSGADARQTDADGTTALMAVCWDSNLSSTQRVALATRLVQLGVKLDSKDRLGHTALLYAVNTLDADLAGLFLKWGMPDSEPGLVGVPLYNALQMASWKLFGADQPDTLPAYRERVHKLIAVLREAHFFTDDDINAWDPRHWHKKSPTPAKDPAGKPSGT